MTYSSDQLAQVEQSLAVVAQSNEASTARLDRMEALAAATLEGLAEIKKIVESNARAIEAWGTRIEEVQVDTEEAPSSTKADLAVQMEDNAHNQGVDRVRFDRLHAEHNQRFNNLLEEARADRQRADREREAFQQRFDETAARADRDRALNESEHRTARETFQTMLAVIARLWHRETD